MKKLTLTADVVLPISSDPIRGGAVVVENGRIIYVGTAEQVNTAYPGLRRIENPCSVILPGFVNAHTHLELSWTERQLVDFEDFTGWLEQIINLKMQSIDPDSVLNSMREGVSQVVRSGVTTVGEISSVDFYDKEILRESGLRVIAFVELFDHFLPQISSLEFVAEDLYEERPFPHAPYSCAPELLQAVFSRAEKEKIAVGLHLGESLDEVEFLKNAPNGFEQKIFPLVGKQNFARPWAKTPTRYIDLFIKGKDVRLSAVHMVQTGVEDSDVIGDENFGIVLCPRSNAFLKVGEPDLRLMARSGRVGLGTDGLSSNRDLDFFEEMRFLHRMMIRQGIGCDEATRLSVRFATLGGAEALFIEEKVGSVEVGKDADLICLERCGDVEPDPFMSVLSSGPQNLRFSMVRGKFVCGKDSFSLDKSSTC